MDAQPNEISLVITLATFDATPGFDLAQIASMLRHAVGNRFTVQSKATDDGGEDVSGLVFKSSGFHTDSPPSSHLSLAVSIGMTRKIFDTFCE